ncbi:MAG: hypothetical protein ACREMH_02610 [Gemmatimonadales bacterium]
MSCITRPAALVAAAAFSLTGCGDRPPTAPGMPGAAGLAQQAVSAANPVQRARTEALARRVALALSDAEARAEVYRALRSSEFREGKVHFQRLLRTPGGRVLEGLARASGASVAQLLAEANEAVPLELYLPVRAHREAWHGSPDYLVATALADHEAPIAFDPRGRRRVLSPDAPPPTPVLGLVPVETDFDRAPSLGAECQDCGGAGSGGGTAGGLPGLGNQNLVLSYAWFKGDFEGWLKGDPEYELHVLSPDGTAPDALRSLQCIGEHAPVGYRWNQDTHSWTGTALILKGTQMDGLESRFPGQGWMVMALEDDDTACEIRMNRDLLGNLLKAAEALYKSHKGLKDIKLTTPDGVKRIVAAGKQALTLWAAGSALIKTNDEMIGFAIRDTVAHMSHSIGNYALMREGVNHGWLRLDVKY